jgi:hypothetical protein
LLKYDPAIPLLGICWKECKLGYKKGTCTPTFIIALFMIAKLWKKPRSPTTDEGIKKCGSYIQWSSIQPQRRMKCCHLEMNGWNWRTSSRMKLARLRRPKAARFLLYAEHRTNINAALL